jgi:hypothetical protein
MSQEDIVKYLRKNHPKWFTSRQIAGALRVSDSSVNFCLCRLRKYDEVREKCLNVRLPSRFGSINKGVLHFAYKRL